ncbi:MAG: ketoacyl-ACP synthase III [Myxococcales bacterium]|nr:ketoacyl-ACP synthase III [Myxococcales bacterium]
MRVLRPAALGRPVRLAGVGAYLPERVVTNADLVAAGAPLDADEMVRLSGIRERRFVAPDQATSDLAAEAGRRALAAAGVSPDAVDRLLVGTVSPDHPSPGAACRVQTLLGLGTVPSMDLTAACSSFLYALDAAARAVMTGDEAVLAVAADVRSRFVDPTDRATCALFGDGAGAAVVTPHEDAESGLLAIGLLADGKGYDAVKMPAGGSRRPIDGDALAERAQYVEMHSGPQVYLAAVEGMLGTAKTLLEAVDLTFDDIAYVVPHQPNKRILDRMGRLAGIPDEKVVKVIETVGNISGATVPVALDHVLRSGAVRAGDRLLLLAAGAGYTAGAALLRVDEALLATVGR